VIVEVVVPPVVHAGRRLLAGQRVDLPDASALALVSVGRVRRVVEAAPKAAAAAPTPHQKKR